MGAITWTKSWSASDNGTVFGGADIQNIQNDITTVVNGNITNTNVGGSAAIVESKIAFNTSTGHDHDGSNSKSISSTNIQRGSIWGCECEWVSNSSVKAESGQLEINGSLYTRTSYATTIDMTTDGDWVEGTSQEAANTWFYIYAYNNTGTSWDIKFWAQAPQYANAGTDDSSIKIFRQSGGVWYRCLGAVRNNASSNLLQFTQYKDEVWWDIPINVVSVVNSSGNWSAATDCSTAIPPISTRGKFAVEGIDATNPTAMALIKPFGYTWATNVWDGNYVTLGGATAASIASPYECPTDVNQDISYQNQVDDTDCNIDVFGYILDIR